MSLPFVHRYGWLILLVSTLTNTLSAQPIATIDPSRIQIARDQWGVAHIFAPNDAEVAYGLAWANAEDNFATMQELYVMATGRAGRRQGVGGALYDFSRQAFHVPQLVQDRYERDQSPEFRRYIEGYVQGLNAYAASHPKEVIDKKLFPITGPDIIQGYVMATMQEQGLIKQVARVFGRGFDTLTTAPAQVAAMPGKGSNGLALSRKRSDDGQTTRLLINPHQPLTGVGSVYEVHLCSNEGLNVHGGLWHGSMNPGTFASEHLALMTTTNLLDFTDVYQLRLNPANDRQYWFDGTWRDLQPQRIKVKTKVWKFVKINLKRTVYQSVYGPAFRTKTGTFALRSGGSMRIGIAEKLYRMNKARSFAEFKQAANQFPFENFVYADKSDTIYLVNNGLVPKRNPAYNWAKTLPGDTSATLWTDFHAIDELVSYLNPQAGYLYNTNNTTFRATDSTENKKPQDYPAYFGDRYSGQNNRALRLEQLMHQFGPTLSDAEFRALKYDTQLPASSLSTTFLTDVQHLNERQYPDVADLIRQFKNWDRRCIAESEAAGSFLVLTWYLYTQKGLPNFDKRIAYDTATYGAGLRYVKNYLNQHFHKAAVPMGELLRYRRGSVDLPLFGYPDVLGAVTPSPGKDGVFTPIQGDGFVMFVSFGPTGVSLETSQAYGNSSHPDSPHYTDQMANYVNRKTKAMTLNREEVLKKAIRTYAPGQ